MIGVKVGNEMIKYFTDHRDIPGFTMTGMSTQVWSNGKKYQAKTIANYLRKAGVYRSTSKRRTYSEEDAKAIIDDFKTNRALVKKGEADKKSIAQIARDHNASEGYVSKLLQRAGEHHPEPSGPRKINTAAEPKPFPLWDIYLRNKWDIKSITVALACKDRLLPVYSQSR